MQPITRSKASALAGILLLLPACARFTTTQTDITYDPESPEKPVRAITTEASAWTFWESESQLANWKAQQNNEEQGAEVGSLNQSATSTNVVEGIKSLENILRLMTLP